MNFWQALVIAIVPSVAVVLTAALGFRDLGMRRRLEMSKQFLNLFATAHGRPVDGRDGVGVGEQIATIHLIADFAASESLVRNAAREGLRELATWGKSVDASAKTIVQPLPYTRPDDKVVDVPGKAAALLKRGSSEARIAHAATEALKRLR